MKEKIFEKKNFLKIIAGIENTKLVQILRIAKIASLYKSEALDICDNLEIIERVRDLLSSEPDNYTKLFVSSLEAKKLIKAEQAGADYLELGNYDHLYQKKIQISTAEIIKQSKELLEQITDPQKICITIPGYLSVNKQAELTQKLIDLGIKIFQTEGGTISEAKSSGAIGLIEKAKVTLANTIELRKSFPEICIITAGGLSSLTVPLAIAAGASGVGVGKLVNRLNSEVEISATILSLKLALKSPEQQKTRI